MSQLSPDQYASWKRIVAEMEQTFSDAAKKRKNQPGWTKDPMTNFSQPDWVLSERQVMLDAVNALRTRMGKEPVEMRSVYKAEISASGHSDYYRKFPLYCAEIVFHDKHTP